MAKLPPIPSTAFSHLGPTPVALKKMRGLWGLTEFAERRISINNTLTPDSAWQTFWHECVHLALFDAGVKLRTKAEERVCDALGTYLAAAMRAGVIKVQP